MKQRFAVLLLLLALSVPSAYATVVVVNSDDWIDVYSGTLFAYLQGYNAKFLTTKRYAALLPLIIPKDEKVLVVESQRVPFTVNLGGALSRQGFDVDTIYASGGRATNVELAKMLENVRNFIIVDPSYGYNAVSVAPYALVTNSYVLFGDKRNVDQLLAFLKSRSPNKLLLYGELDDELLEALAPFSPEIINEGNRYKDNIKILEKHLSLMPALQLILTDGSLIEQELMLAGKNKEATLLVGKDAVPEVVIDFAKNSNFRSAILIGNHLSQSGKQFKDATGIPVFMKFGKGITKGKDSEPVRALDMFFLPVIDLNMVLRAVQYNAFTKEVEITYDNKGIRAFALTSAGILADGKRVLTIGDKDVQRVGTNETIAFTYPADLSEYLAAGRNLSVDLFTLYGESPEMLDHAVAFTGPLRVVSVEDKCELDVKSLAYDSRTQRFVVKIKNTGSVDCVANVELVDVIINDEPIIVATPGTERIPARKTGLVRVKQRMTPVDLADNPEVLVRVRYGQRQEFLLKQLEKRFPLEKYEEKQKISTTLVLLVGVILVLFLIIIVLLVRQRKRRQK